MEPYKQLYYNILIYRTPLYFYALSDPQALLSVVSTIRRSGVVVTFVAGALMFRERQIGTKAALLAVVLSGVALLYFG